METVAVEMGVCWFPFVLWSLRRKNRVGVTHFLHLSGPWTYCAGNKKRALKNMQIWNCSTWQPLCLQWAQNTPHLQSDGEHFKLLQEYVNMTSKSDTCWGNSVPHHVNSVFNIDTFRKRARLLLHNNNDSSSSSSSNYSKTQTLWVYVKIIWCVLEFY